MIFFFPSIRFHDINIIYSIINYLQGITNNIFEIDTKIYDYRNKYYTVSLYNLHKRKSNQDRIV